MSDNRAYTNLLSGSMRLLDVPMNQLSSYLVQGRLPPLFLPSFLHESTHFWCMASDLGSALALRDMRRQHGFSSDEQNQAQLVRDFAIVDFTHKLLRPLLEGMALFQEFDAIPGDSNVFCTPGLWAARLFMPPDEDPSKLKPEERVDWITGKIVDNLVDYRTSADAHRRKISVLMRPLIDDPDGYLSGYLAVKNLWRNAVILNPAFIDRDLFLSYLQAWVFQDWLLIDYIVRDDFSPDAATYFISERLRTRLCQLAATNLSHQIAIYDEECGSGRRDPALMLQSLDLDQDETGTAQERFRGMLREIHEGIGSENENWYFGDMALLEHRHKLMQLAVEPVAIEVNDFDRVIVRKEGSAQGTMEGVYFGGQAPDEAERGTTPGWITAYFLPQEYGVMISAIRDNQPMLATPVENVPDEEMSAYQFAITTVVRAEESRRELTALARSLVADLGDPEYERAAAISHTTVNTLYASLAFGCGPGNERYDALMPLLARKGLYDLLGKDGDLLSAIVDVSLVPTLTETLAPHVRASLLEKGIDLDDALLKLREIQEAKQMSLIEDLGDSYWAAV